MAGHQAVTEAKEEKAMKFLITHKGDIHTFNLATGQDPFPSQICGVISTKSSRISTNLPEEKCAYPPAYKEEDVGSHSGTHSFPTCLEDQGQIVCGQAECCRQAKHENMRSALPHGSSGTPVSDGSRRMCSFV